MTFVVSADEGSGGTWAGAVEALERGYGRVAAWVGAGARDGNHALVGRGAVPVAELSDLFTIDPTIPPPDQTSLF